jgi:hypothetical protein
MSNFINLPTQDHSVELNEVKLKRIEKVTFLLIAPF